MSQKLVAIRKIMATDAEAYYNMTRIKQDEALKRVHGLVASNRKESEQLVEYLSKLDFVHDFGFLICYDKTPVGYILATEDILFSNCLNVAAFCAASYRRKGIMTEAMQLFIDFCKRYPNSRHNSLILDIESDNIASIKSAKKLDASYLCNVSYSTSNNKPNKKIEYCRFIKAI